MTTLQNARPKVSHVAFADGAHLCSGALSDVAAAVIAARGEAPPRTCVVLEHASGRVVDVDAQDVAAAGQSPALETVPAPEAKGRGRPKLGVVGREVTLLPRHWAWLSTQRGGASATLRRLVETARKASESGDARRRAQDRAYAFILVLLGDAPDFEAATRALYAADREGFWVASASWPDDLRTHARAWSEGVWALDVPAASPQS